MKQADPETPVTEKNRHIRAPQAPGATAASETVPERRSVLSRDDAVKNARRILSQEDSNAAGLSVGDDAHGERLTKKFGLEIMNQLTEEFEEMASRVLPSPLEDEYLEALDVNCAVSVYPCQGEIQFVRKNITKRIEFEPEYLMGEFDSNPDIDEKEPIPLRDALEKMKPFLMAYEGIQSQEELGGSEL
ncbi:hypothetical protein SESBI_44326 [Sesbania bispinosa]|nr:hypothetical protein SESBI_44326 [Sesbania bispinosa]